MENEEKAAEIISAKIGAIPTENAWSQAYSAGSLFAVLSLNQELLEQSDQAYSLSSIGKGVLDGLEKEYFTLEEKNLSSIKEAIEKAIQNIPPLIKTSLIIAVIPFSSSYDNVLYVFILGEGKILLKREDRLGTILSSSEEMGKTISASGFLENNDLIILQTEKFASLVDYNKLLSSCDNLSPSDIAEDLSPEIHKKQEGDTSAIFIRYAKKSTEKEMEMEEIIDQSESKKMPNFLKNFYTKKLPFIKNLGSFQTHITHTKKMLLTISIILVFVLILSIFFATKKKEDEKTKNLFQNIYTSAKLKYDEGQGLLRLNQNTAREDFKASAQILLNARNQFKKDSSERKQIEDLLQKVDASLAQTSGKTQVALQKVDKDKSPILALEIEKQSSSSLYAQSDEAFYILSPKDVQTINKNDSSKSKVILKNNGDWQKPKSFGTYLGNIYILDSVQKQIIKFINAGDSFGKSTYFQSSNLPDLSSAVSMTIDGSIWLLYQDGSIQKFTKGSRDEFDMPVLDVPLKGATVIRTDTDSNNLYILDPLNKRLVVISKDGKSQKQYYSDLFSKAKDIDVVEKDKIVYVLIGKDVYKMEMK